jgi:hypothetical protein
MERHQNGMDVWVGKDMNNYYFDNAEFAAFLYVNRNIVTAII